MGALKHLSESTEIICMSFLSLNLEAYMKSGKRSFIIRYGVVGWGLSTGLIWASMMMYVMPVAPWWLYFVIGVPLFMLGGWPFAEFLWWWQQRVTKTEFLAANFLDCGVLTKFKSCLSDVLASLIL